MTQGTLQFTPGMPLVEGLTHPACRAVVTVPARNEESRLPRCLAALAGQVDMDGAPLPVHTFEVLLLVNNCTDSTAAVAHAWQAAHPEVQFHVVERRLPAEQAHVGTARRLLMDTAWRRLQGASAPVTALLSTDADTEVASDWIAQNLRALEQGADVVGGLVEAKHPEVNALPAEVQRCYRDDRRYAGMIAHLEHLLDPSDGDPWPRHLDHFGSSLACTPRSYEKAGGMPAVSPLEDEAFVDQVRRAGLTLRHDPAVRVYTSARMDGRAEVGLAGQFRLWQQLQHASFHVVPSAAFLEHRFRTLRQLRQIFHTKEKGAFHLPTEWWKNTFREALEGQHTCPEFLAAVYCDILIEESFHGEREEPIGRALAGLQGRIEQALAELAEAGCYASTTAQAAAGSIAAPNPASVQ